MARTQIELSIEQSHKVRDLLVATTELATFETDWELQRQAKLTALQEAQGRALLNARAAKVPLRLLLPALGTTNPNRLYLIEARATAQGYAPPSPTLQELAPTTDWPDVLSGSRNNDGTWTVRTTQPVPPALWTYPDVFERAPIQDEPWEGELDFIVDNQGPLFVPSVGNPLQREWQAQNPSLIEFVKKVVTES